MADATEVLKVPNEETAWDVLSAALEGRLPPERGFVVDFQEWPRIHIVLPNTPLSGSITPTMMEAFIELQKTLYRAHTFVTADTGDLRVLSRAEKEALEFRVKVDEGSDVYDVDLSEIVQRIGAEAISKMDSIHIVITVIGVALIVGGVVAFKAWLNNKAEQRKAEYDDADKQRWLEAHQAALDADGTRMRVLAEAMARQPLLQEVEASAEAARQQIVKAVADQRGGTVSGVRLDAEFASEVIAQKRQQSQSVRLAGNYNIAKVDTTVLDGFRVTLVDVGTGEEVTAAMQDALLSEEHRRVVQDAEWHKRPVFVEMAARRLRKRIVDAVIINAREAAPAKPRVLG